MMSMLQLVLSELRWRWGTAVVAAALIAFACGAVLFTDALARGSADATRRIQRDIGPNLVILPGETDVGSWMLDRRTEGSIPEDALDALEAEGLAGRLIPLVQQPVTVSGHRFLLTGVGRERSGSKRGVLAPATSEQGAIIGSEVGRTLGIEAGGMFELIGGEVSVHEVLQPQGSIDDISIHVPLRDVQRRLNLSGQLTQIDALECRCGAEIEDPLAWLQDRVRTVLPTAQIVRRRAPAEARRSQRALADATARVAGPAAALVAMCIVAGLAWLNVRGRRAECGVLRALGFTRSGVLALLLGRWAFVGIAGAIAALAICGWAIDAWSPRWWWVLVAAPAAAMLIGSLPALIGASADPVEALRE